MVSFFYKFIAAFISLFVFGLSVTAPFSNTTDNGAEMNAIIMSDIHMETNNTERFSNLKSIFKGVANSSVKPDAVCFAGDNVMNGQDLEWFLFYGFLDKAGILDSTKVIVAQGNHDFGNTDDDATYDTLSKKAIKMYNAFCDRDTDKVYYSTDVNGYKIIALASEENMEDTVSHIGDDELEWLRNELAGAGGKPVVVINHNLIAYTNIASYFYNNNVDNSEALQEVLESYDGHVFYFAGHSHFGLDEDSIYNEDNVTYINMPATGNDSYFGANDECVEWGIGCQFSLYGDHAELCFINYMTGKPVQDFEKISIEY